MGFVLQFIAYNSYYLKWLISCTRENSHLLQFYRCKFSIFLAFVCPHNHTVKVAPALAASRQLLSCYWPSDVDSSWFSFQNVFYICLPISILSLVLTFLSVISTQSNFYCVSGNESGMKDTEPLKMFKVNRTLQIGLHYSTCVFAGSCVHTHIHTHKQKKPKANKKTKNNKKLQRIISLMINR